MRYILKIIGVLIVGSLFFLLLFMMPLEFCVSSWHLWRVDSVAEGRVLSSEQLVHKGNTRSIICYTYTVDGQVFESDRVRAGWVSNKAFEDGGGSLAKSTPVGSPVTVRYDSSYPEFSLLAYGWPKWSIGFSLAVWCMVFSAPVFGSQDRRPSSHLLYGLTRGGIAFGFLIIIFLPPTIEPEMAFPLIGAGIFLILVASVYSRLRYSESDEHP